MNEIEEIQKWYHSQYNEDWEHGLGISVETLDNPGWSVKIDIDDTNLENKAYEEFSYGVGDKADERGDNWLITKLEGKQFVGYSGPYKLKEILGIFIKWSQSMHNKLVNERTTCWTARSAASEQRDPLQKRYVHTRNKVWQ